MTTAATDTLPPFGLSAPAPLDRPVRKGRVVRVPERWKGPLSGAPFEAVVADGGTIALGVGLSCPKGRLRPGALWVVCENGTDLMNRAMALDAALALAGSQHSKDAQDGLENERGKIAGVPAIRLLEALIWMEAGAGRNSSQDGTTAGVWVSGARALFADKARGLKQALSSRLPGDCVALAEPSPSAVMH